MLPWHKIKFGIELEGAPEGVSNAVIAQRIRRERPRVDLPRMTWDVGCDGDGIEVKTPAGTDVMWTDIHQTLDLLLDAGVEEGRGSGLHVHLDVEHLTDEQKIRLLRFWAYYEDVMFFLVEPYRRTSGWCRPMLEGNYRNLLADLFRSDIPADQLLESYTRTAFGPNGGWPTFECRIHHSDFSFHGVFTWVNLLRMCYSKWVWSDDPTPTFEQAHSRVSSIARLADRYLELEAIVTSATQDTSRPRPATMMLMLNNMRSRLRCFAPSLYRDVMAKLNPPVVTQ